MDFVSREIYVAFQTVFLGMYGSLTLFRMYFCWDYGKWQECSQKQSLDLAIVFVLRVGPEELV